MLTYIALLAVIFLLLCFIGYLLRINDRLVEKVMAKDYNDYKSNINKPIPAPVVDTPKRKPMSWADTSHLEELEE